VFDKGERASPCTHLRACSGEMSLQCLMALRTSRLALFATRRRSA
jgi:hypothetical protein